MKIPLVGASYQEDSLPFNAERSINLYPVLDQQGKEVSALYGTPGLKPFTTCGIGPIREEFYSATGRAFCISGTTLYEFYADGTTTSRGTIKQSSGNIYFSENTTQLGVCDGTNLYILTYSSNNFEQIVGGLEYSTNGSFASDTGWTKGSGWSITGGHAAASSASTALSQNAAYTIVSGRTYTVTYTVASLSAGTVTASVGGTAGTARSANGTYTDTIVAGSTQVLAFTGSGFTGNISAVSVQGPENGFPNNIGTLTVMDGFFIVNVNLTKQFYKSALNDGTSWNALDYASKESSPDYLKRVIRAFGQLCLLGDETTEVWYDSGASSFPFQRLVGAIMQQGIYAPASAQEIDNSLMWLGKNIEGYGVVFRATGFYPQRISTTPIELLIGQATDPTNIKSYKYQRNGHLFYILTGGGLPTSLVYDVTTQMWHERAYLNNGIYETAKPFCCVAAFGHLIVGDKDNNNLYYLDEETYDDNGDPLSSERIFTHLSQEDMRVRYNRLVIYFESGVGTQTGQGQNPVAELWASKDGGRTWLGGYTASIGAAGAFQTKAAWRQLGVAETMTFKVRITDPVKRRLIGAYLS
ncbi:MAG: hypothetical protein KGL39_17860 [Patescibacteria group bacterium]|nr:hypothetical protein [Patescibacteria group bacterium]